MHVWSVGPPSLQPHVLEEGSRKGSSEFPASELVSVLNVALKALCMLVSSPFCLRLPSFLL